MPWQVTVTLSKRKYAGQSWADRLTLIQARALAQMQKMKLEPTSAARVTRRPSSGASTRYHVWYQSARPTGRDLPEVPADFDTEQGPTHDR